MKRKDTKLGLGRNIKRRDFIGGVALALSGNPFTCAWAESPTPLDLSSASHNSVYPPTRTGMRGSHPGSFEVAHQLRDGKRWTGSAVQDIGEQYDLVVVGAGISGLSAAWFYQEANPKSKILILDNHDDFGGHAKRNEFWHKDQLLLAFGGAINIENFNDYGPDAQRLIHAIGISPERYSEFLDSDLYPSLGLQRGTFFDRETFGEDRVVAGVGKPSWPDFLARTPLSETARADIARLYDKSVDYLAGLSLEKKRQRLRSMSYQQYLLEVVGIKPESLPFLRNDGYWAIGIDALPAWVAVRGGAPGTQGLGFDEEEEDERVYFQFPDGNASIARSLVRSLIPSVAPGSTMEDVVTAKFDYTQLDQGDSRVRLRLDSTVVDVRHQGDPRTASEVEITYVQNGQANKVRTAKTVLACYNSVIPYLCDELPKAQKTALSHSLKAPLIYTNVLVKNWTAFENLGVSRLNCPGSYFSGIRLASPIHIGDYKHSGAPDQPIVLQLFRNPLAPGLSAQDQWRAGRRDIYSTTFETFERHIRDQLNRSLSPGGFNAARDIEAITVNRWPHGYAYGHNPATGEVAYMLDEVPREQAPWIAARQPFGRIAIANSDAAANAMAEGAIGEAHRAVMDLPT